MSEDTAVVVPEPGQGAATARALLDLADHVHDVRTINGGNAFVVPAAVAEAYMETVQPPRGKRARKSTTKEA